MYTIANNQPGLAGGCTMYITLNNGTSKEGRWQGGNQAGWCTVYTVHNIGTSKEGKTNLVNNQSGLAGRCTLQYTK